MSEYEPGTVAVATVRGVPGVRVFRTGGALSVDRNMWASAKPVDHRSWHPNENVTDVRPLVTLDLSLGAVRPEQVAGYAVEVLRTPRHQWADHIADQIEAQTRPPKPEEPTGRYAVVEDDRAREWVLADPATTPTPWKCLTLDRWAAWDEITAVRVLSEGVQP